MQVDPSQADMCQVGIGEIRDDCIKARDTTGQLTWITKRLEANVVTIERDQANVGHISPSASPWC